MNDMDRGLYSKYHVTKADGTPLDGDCFVLRPDRDPAARCALKEYAYQTPNGELASDIEDWLDRIGEVDYTTREATQMMDASDKYELAALRTENERIRVERDALIASIHNNDVCATCRHRLPDGCSAIRNGWRCRYVHPSEAEARAVPEKEDQQRLDAIRALRACGEGKAACAKCPFDEPRIPHWYPQCLFRAVATATDHIARLTADLAAMTAERDALRERAEAAESDLNKFGQCGSCQNHYRANGCGANDHSWCDGGYKWRGPVEGKEVPQ